MENEQKYYTPTIEEFHVGFETEWKIYDSDNYIKVISDESIFNIDYCIQQSLKSNLIRVKYLDKEDIESLGFFGNEYFSKENKSDIQLVCDKETNYRGTNQLCRLIYNINSKWLLVYIETKSLFAGYIKNKSEL